MSDTELDDEFQLTDVSESITISAAELEEPEVLESSRFVSVVEINNGATPSDITVTKNSESSYTIGGFYGTDYELDNEYITLLSKFSKQLRTYNNLNDVINDIWANIISYEPEAYPFKTFRYTFEFTGDQGTVGTETYVQDVYPSFDRHILAVEQLLELQKEV